MGLRMLLDLEQARSFVRTQEDLVRSLKLALVTHDPKRLSAMFPALAPPDNNEAIKALDSGAPVEIRSTVKPEDAQDFLRRMASGELAISEIDDVMDSFDAPDPGFDF